MIKIFFFLFLFLSFFSSPFFSAKVYTTCMYNEAEDWNIDWNVDWI